MKPWLKRLLFSSFSTSSAGIDLAGLVVLGVDGQELRLEGPVLHDLRRQLDGVAGHGPAAVAALREERRQRVAELVEERLDLVGREERRRVGRRPGEVAGDRRHGRHALALLVVGAPEAARPGAAALARPRVEVHVEDAEVPAVGLEDLEDLDLGVVARQVGLLDELQAVELVAQGEDAVADVVELEVGPQGGVVEGVFLLAQLLGVVPPIPGGELELAGLVAVDEGLERGRLLAGLDQGRLPELLEEGVDLLGRLGHVVLQDEGGVVGVAEELGPLEPQGRDLAWRSPCCRARCRCRPS